MNEDRAAVLVEAAFRGFAQGLLSSVASREKPVRTPRRRESSPEKLIDEDALVGELLRANRVVAEREADTTDLEIAMAAVERARIEHEMYTHPQIKAGPGESETTTWAQLPQM